MADVPFDVTPAELVNAFIHPPKIVGVAHRAESSDLADTAPGYRPTTQSHDTPADVPRRGRNLLTLSVGGLGVVLVVLLTVVAGPFGDETAVAPPAHSTVVGGDVVMDDVLPPGAWTGARTSAVGQSLLLFFVGAAAYEPSQSCTMRYVPVVEETQTAIHVVIRGEHPPAADATACTLVGYPRSVTVELAQPFGDRTLVALGQSRRVFDGSTLAEPQWIPDGWQPSSESPGLLDPGTATSWIRSWVPPVPPPGEGSCLLGASGLALLEGSPDVVNRSTPPAEQTITGTHDINGSSATSSIQTNRNITRLAWTTGNRSYLLSSSPACDGDQPPSLDIMLRFARSLDTSTSR